ncbi:hypothetical protein H8K32_17370 [Undibacterium jejuense]|uniref:Uncharacterized protein n=1 Tax=Undibacterium jejuense TaxID=1344949 RepID=A0A923KM85_9BURK|nr:hypothetical protein [Undibacterium jejuense]MBC3863880.1 hypothetical protein [Undibacterium jejuense]
MSIARIFRCLSIWLVLAGLTASSFAQVAADRQFPPNAKRGILDMSNYPNITMDGYPRRLAPSSRIFAVNNLIVMPATLSGSNIVVHYTENSFRDIDKVWILTKSEIAKGLPDPNAQANMPMTN